MHGDSGWEGSRPRPGVLPIAHMTGFHLPKRIAIVGTGIAGLTAAYFLQRRYAIEVFEANDYIGGHTNTIIVSHRGQPLPVDTGFIVYNTHTYPNLTRLFAELDVPTEWSDMSFSVSDRQSGLEYGSRSATGIFAQRRNLFRPRYWQMLRDYLRFCREAKAATTDARFEKYTLMQFVTERGYGDDFVRFCLVPGASAIWSSPHTSIANFPAQYFFEFYRNHGLLDIPTSVRWRTVTGGSHVYVQKMTQCFRERIHLNCAVRAVHRQAEGATLTLADGSKRAFDAVVLATHSDQTLRLLADPSPTEHDILSHIPYQANLAVLHTDERVLPRNRRAWASWNYTLYAKQGEAQGVAMTYWMNALQNLRVDANYCVTINPQMQLAEDKIIQTIQYAHPLYSLEGLAARRRLPEINGQQNTYFCGAWCGYGFHEDGMKSGLVVADLLGAGWDSAREQRTGNRGQETEDREWEMGRQGERVKG